MSQEMRMTGMVLQAMPYGEYDRRVILLTKEAGKITAFARGARKPTSSMLSATSAFNFGTFRLFPGRSAYTLAGAEIKNYFQALKGDLDGSFYASYFMEMAAYYGRENLDASQMLNLLYVSLLALEKPSLPDPLVRRIFEIRLMVINGEFPREAAQDPRLGQSAAYAMRYVIAAPLDKLFTFSLSQEALGELAAVTELVRVRTIDTRMKSLEILETTRYYSRLMERYAAE